MAGIELLDIKFCRYAISAVVAVLSDSTKVHSDPSFLQEESPKPKRAKMINIFFMIIEPAAVPFLIYV